MVVILETSRLIFRTWQDQDLDLMLQINQDANVMEYFPGLQGLETTQNFIQKVRDHFDKFGFSLYAVVRKDNEEFIGFIGLMTVDFDAHFTPATEIGWRLGSKHWGLGFATEGAKAILDHSFRVIELPEIVSFTSKDNARSIRVMQKIGLKYNSMDDFDHPKLDTTSPLRQHVLYRLSRSHYLGELP